LRTPRHLASRPEAEAVAVILFFLADVPFRLRRRRA